MTKIMTKEEIIAKLDDIDYTKRCHTANICPVCGLTFKKITSYGRLPTIVTCKNEDCPEYNKKKGIVR